MNRINLISLWVCLSIFFGTNITSWAQSSLKELTVQYNKPYQLDNSYSIIYDNPSQTVKLHEFKIEFYDAAQVKIGETEIESYPFTGTLEGYTLSAPIVGFNEVKLVILSLHQGEVADFPPVANSILALNELTEYIEVKEKKKEGASTSTPELSEMEALKEQVRTLQSELTQATQSTTKAGTEITSLQKQVRTLDDEIIELKDRNKNQQDLINTQIQIIKDPIETIKNRDEVIETQAEDVRKLNAEITELKRISTIVTRSSSLWKAATAALALLSLGLAGRLLSRWSKLEKTSSQQGQIHIGQRPPKPKKSGVIFSNSPMLAGALAPGPTSLAPLGQMIPSGLQTLTGQYAALKPAYRATGRIGGPQEGKPTNDDVAFGTGFLITPNHVMTNQHVYEFYKHYLTGEDCGGIEFIAERDRDASDYVPFNGEPPLILPDLDIAIFTLARSVTDRKPIERIAVPTEELDEREVITVSYPCPYEVDELILSVVEKDPIFAVKRLSQGRVFRHTTDTDTPFGVQVNVDARINPKKSLLAICHNASTLGGSSGAPVLDKAGNLVGVHFAGDRAFNGEEAANLAMAIEMLADIKPTMKGEQNIT